MYKAEFDTKFRGTGIEAKTNTGFLSPEQVQGLLRLLANCSPDEFDKLSASVHGIFKENGVIVPSSVFEEFEERITVKRLKIEEPSLIIRSIRKVFGITV